MIKFLMNLSTETPNDISSPTDYTSCVANAVFDSKAYVDYQVMVLAGNLDILSTQSF